MGNDNYQYRMFGRPKDTPEYRREKARQHRVKLISVFVITLECIIGIGVVCYFAMYGT